jgi:hypothetical protein
MTTRRRTKGERRSGPRYEYEDETSVRSARGTVRVAEGVWWSGEIVVPMTGERALIQVEHYPESPAPSDATLAVPLDEIDALLTLLGGVVAQARRAGVLPAQPAATTRTRGPARRGRRRATRSRKP